MFFHGNAEDVGIAFEILLEIRNCLKVIIQLLNMFANSYCNLQVSILAMEYPGYGLYCCEKDSERLMDDALTVYDHMTQKRGVS